MDTDQPPPAVERTTVKRPRWRFRALLAFAIVSLGLYGFVRLDRSTVERLGPVAQAIHGLFNQEPGEPPPITSAARRLKADVEAVGGEVGVNVTRRGFFGTFGQVEWFNVTSHDPNFDDASLARIADAHGGEIESLYLENTAVTDAGLASLSKFPRLKNFEIRNDVRKAGKTGPLITDAGMAHLKGLTQLQSLNVSYTSVTDAGLDSIDDLPYLMSLYLGGTDVKGVGISRLKSLPKLALLDLHATPFGEEGLKALSGATDLQILTLQQVRLNPESLPLLKAIPRLREVDITGCGFLDEEVADLKKSKPGLKVQRR
jgi:hypothetical protein